MWEIVFAAAWLWCGWLAAGYDYAAYENNYNARWPAFTALIFAIDIVFGMVALLVVFVDGTAQHGRLYPWQSTRWKK